MQWKEFTPIKKEAAHKYERRFTTITDLSHQGL